MPLKTDFTACVGKGQDGFSAIISYMMMFCGLDKIDAENVVSAYARFSTYEKLNGPLAWTGQYITPEITRNYMGAKANVSPMTNEQFKSRIIKNLFNDQKSEFHTYKVPIEKDEKIVYRISEDDVVGVLKQYVKTQIKDISEEKMQEYMELAKKYLNSEGMPWADVVKQAVLDVFPQDNVYVATFSELVAKAHRLIEEAREKEQDDYWSGCNGWEINVYLWDGQWLATAYPSDEDDYFRDQAVSLIGFDETQAYALSEENDWDYVNPYLFKLVLDKTVTLDENRAAETGRVCVKDIFKKINKHWDIFEDDDVITLVFHRFEKIVCKMTFTKNMFTKKEG